jgi:hypothetical protein
MTSPDAGLLAGPRGRRLCFLLSHGGAPPGWGLPDLEPEELGLSCLATVVSIGMYWQQPDETDRRLTDPEVAESLAPVAAEVASRSDAAWWRDGVALEDQRYVEWLDASHSSPPMLRGALGELHVWRESTAADERRADRPDDPATPWSGTWWSVPSSTGLVRTSRRTGALPAVTATLVEDEQGYLRARCHPLRATRPPRVYEIAGPDDWTALVERYPMTVTRSRRQDWYRATGGTGPWLIPDYVGVARDFDAVHLSVWAHLTTAGRALPAGSGWTVLAGWNPDETYWLTDVLEVSRPPEDFTRDPDLAIRWSRST